MSDNYKKLLDLMRQTDEKREAMDQLELQSFDSKLRSQTHQLIDNLSADLSTDLTAFESKISQIMGNEEFIKLYFCRFVVSGQQNGDHLNGGDGRCYWRANDRTVDAMRQLLPIMASLAANSPGIDGQTGDGFDLKFNTQKLAKILRDFQSGAMKSLAKNDIKLHDTKQVLLKFGLKDLIPSTKK